MGCLEETFCGSGTSHKINGIIIHREFIEPLPKVNRAKIEKSKKQNLCM